MHDTAVVRRRFGYGYFATTFIVWCVMVVTQFGFEWQNTHQLPNMWLRDVCTEIWFVSSLGIIALQLACLAMMAFPPGFIRGGLTSGIRITVACFAVIVLLTNPWAAILYVVMRGGTLD
jgi:hypothetical protein